MGCDSRRTKIDTSARNKTLLTDAFHFGMKIEHMKLYYKKDVYVQVPTSGRDVGFSKIVGVISYTTDRFFVVSSLYDPNVRFCCLYKDVAINSNAYKILTEYEAFSMTDSLRRSIWCSVREAV